MLLRPSRPTLFGRRLLATLANPSSSSPQPVFGLDEAALDLPPPKPEGPNGLLPVSPSSRLSRLEYHYLNTLREDLMILHYDHGSRLLQKLDSLPEWTEGTRAPEDLLARVFSVQDPIARDRVKGGGPSRYGPPTPTTRPLFLSTSIRRPFKNPIDYTTHKPNREWRILPKDPFPYAPLASRLPKLETITLYIFPEKAHQNKMSVLTSIFCLQSVSGLKAEPYFAPMNDANQNFKEGQVAGAFVTIEQGDRMWSFLDRFVNCVLPRIREWNGFNGRQAFKGSGEVRLRLDASAVGYFPEIEPYFDQYPALYDMEISFQTSAKSRNEAISLLSGFQIPFLDRETELATLEAERKKEEEKDPFAKFKKGRKKSSVTARGNAVVGRAKK